MNMSQRPAQEQDNIPATTTYQHPVATTDPMNAAGRALDHIANLLRRGGPVEATDALLVMWIEEGVTDSTADRLGELSRRFALRLTATGIPHLAEATADDCEGFIWAPTRRGKSPSVHTVHLRRTAIRNLFRIARQLDPTIVDPTAATELPGKKLARVRPLDDSEIELVRIAALGRVTNAWRTACAVALCEATASTGELLRISWDEISLDQRQIRLPGATPIRARTAALSAWGAGVLAQSPVRTGHVLSYRGDRFHHSGQAAMVNLISATLRSAGVADRFVRPASIRLWAARRVLDADGIQAAAIALGVASLDVAAEALGHGWMS